MAVGNVSSTKRHQQIVKMMVVVLGFFAILALPWHLADIILDTEAEQKGHPAPANTQLITREVAALLIFVNGWAMPIIYASFNAGVKKRITSMLTCGSSLCRWKRVEPENTAQDAGYSTAAAQPASGNVQMSHFPA